MVAISGVGASYTGMSNASRSLNETQKQGLTDVLENYDADSLSDDDAKALVQEIKDLGIKSGSGLTDALSSAGIDAGELAQQAGIGAANGGPDGAKGPPPGGGGGGRGGPGGAGGAEASKGPDDAAVELMQSVVEQMQEAYDEDEIGTNFAIVLQQALEDAGLDTSSPIVDYRV